MKPYYKRTYLDATYEKIEFLGNWTKLLYPKIDRDPLNSIQDSDILNYPE